MQRYFLEKDADAYLGAPQDLVDNSVKLVDAFRAAGKPIVFTRHAHKKGGDLGQMGRWWNGKLPFEGDPQSDLIDAISPEGEERLLTKVRYSAFEGTDLDEWLKARGVDTLVICGVMTNLCVETTARHAFMKEIQPVIARDACASSSREFHKAAIKNLEYGFAVIENTTSILATLKEVRR